jgi:flagellar hook-associated protein 1 FlgK
LAQTFNEQHKTGMDMLGNESGDIGFSGDFFTIPNPKVIPGRLNGAAVITASFTTPSLNSNLATGNYVSDLNGSDYRLENVAGTLNLTRLSDKKVWTGANIAAINSQITNQGFQLANPSGALVAGDSFLIEPTREGAKNIGVNQEIITNVQLIAAALPMRATLGLTNAGVMSVKVERNRTDLSVSAPSPTYPLSIAIGAGATALTSSGAGGPFQVNVYASDGTALAGSPFSLSAAVTATSPPIADGYSYELADGNHRTLFTIKGTRLAGDTFTLDKNDASTGGKIGVSDSSNILMLGRLQTQRAADGGATNFQGAYAQMVSDIGNKAHEIEVTQTAQKSLVAQATAAREADSGVNLDEEAANMMKYQQMYQASARALSAGKSIFDELLAVARG